jgi:hypothetical protein
MTFLPKIMAETFRSGLKLIEKWKQYAKMAINS